MTGFRERRVACLLCKREHLECHVGPLHLLFIFFIRLVYLLGSPRNPVFTSSPSPDPSDHPFQVLQRTLVPVDTRRHAGALMDRPTSPQLLSPSSGSTGLVRTGGPVVPSHRNRGNTPFGSVSELVFSGPDYVLGPLSSARSRLRPSGSNPPLTSRPETGSSVVTARLLADLSRGKPLSVQPQKYLLHPPLPSLSVPTEVPDTGFPGPTSPVTTPLDPSPVHTLV